MEGNRRATLTLGVILLLFGGWFLAVQFVPSLGTFVTQFFDWPWYVIGSGLVFFVAAVVGGVPGLAVPGFIIMGVGAILYYQNATGEWYSWSYMWTLILVSIGIGVFVMHLLEGKLRKALKDGGNTILTGLVMFLIFGSFMRPLFGQQPLFGDYWPVALIAIGVWLLGQALWPKPKKKVTVITDDTVSAEEAAYMLNDEPQDDMDIEMDMDVDMDFDDAESDADEIE